MKKRVIFVTGGAGFIGSALIRFFIQNTNETIINIDKLTYAGSIEKLLSVQNSKRYFFHKTDICDYEEVSDLFKLYEPDLIMHLAAESHVDNSIEGPAEFIQTNINGTFNLLEVSRKYLSKKPAFRFHHISTDEVFGDLGKTNNFFNEESRYKPSSPYSASKASSDHLVRAWAKTYNLFTIITNCSNNYGPYQDKEKFIPKVISSILDGSKIPLYGDGLNERDWLFVDDHVEALVTCSRDGLKGGTYNIGGNNTLSNLEVIKKIHAYIKNKGIPVKKLSSTIDFVEDRKGHDFRYAMDTNKINSEMGWKPKHSFEEGIELTIEWHLNNLFLES